MFPTTIIRLPALFGKGLRKNVLYDLLHKKHLDKINLNSSYQFYNLKNLNNDIDKALENNLETLNIATEPIKLSEVVKLCFDFRIKSNPSIEPRVENMLTKHSKILNKTKNYLYLKDEIIDEIRNFKSKGLKNNNE